MNSWIPDTCPDMPPCEFEVDSNGEPLTSIRLCATHAKVANPAVVAAAKNREKNAATVAVAAILNIDASAVAWTIDSKERVSITVDTVKQADVAAALDAALGVGKITVIGTVPIIPALVIAGG